MNRWEFLWIASTLASMFLPITIAFVGSGKRWRAAQDRERARRLVDARMNARLLRLDI